jgi:DNA transformation protein
MGKTAPGRKVSDGTEEKAMSGLSGLPNVGKVLEQNLLAVGIETPERLREVGAKEAFLRIRLQCDPGACLHMLYGIQGAVLGIPDKLLPPEARQELKAFFKGLEGK